MDKVPKILTTLNQIRDNKDGPRLGGAWVQKSYTRTDPTDQVPKILMTFKSDQIRQNKDRPRLGGGSPKIG